MTTKKIPVTTYQEVYVADDGMQFQSYEECEQYECKLNSIDIYESLTEKSVYASQFYCDAGLCMSSDASDGFDVIYIRDHSVVEIVNKLAHGEIIDDTAIGKMMISQYSEADHEIYACYTRDDMVAAFVNAIDNLIGKDD